MSHSGRASFLPDMESKTWLLDGDEVTKSLSQPSSHARRQRNLCHGYSRAVHASRMRHMQVVLPQGCVFHAALAGKAPNQATSNQGKPATIFSSGCGIRAVNRV